MLQGQIDELVQLSIVGSPSQKADALQHLNELKARPDAISIGLSLILSGASSRDEVKLFGVSLIRDTFLSGRPIASEESISLRQTVMGLIDSTFRPGGASATGLQTFVVNNLVHILSLCIKRDYPERWSTAFDDILRLGQGLGWIGVDLVVKIMTELEVEVVVFHEDRTKDEITHNTLIKDTMRATAVIPNILTFLRDAIQSAVHCLAQATTSPQTAAEVAGVSSRALNCLAQLIGWIDINLVVSELYPMLRALLEQNHPLQDEALLCIYEIAKKGMDPVLKAALIQRLDVLPLLVKIIPRFQGSVLLYQVDDRFEKLMLYHKRLGMVIDILFAELLGCWIKYEESLVPTKRTTFGGTGSRGTSNGSSMATTPTTPGTVCSEELLQIIPAVLIMLRSITTEAINLMHHPIAAVAGSVIGSLDRFLQVLKGQKLKAAALETFLTTNALHAQQWFVATEYLDALMVALLQQSQYPADFRLEDVGDDDTDEEFMEGKIEARRLLINCSRIYPQRFLQMLSCFMAEIPQPLSTAPIAAVDISLHVLQSLEHTVVQECKAEFEALFHAFQQTDVRHHPHLLVQIPYFEFSIRHVKLLRTDDIVHLAQALLQRLQIIVHSIHELVRSQQLVPHTTSYLISASSAMNGSTSASATASTKGGANNRVHIPPKATLIKLSTLALKVAEVSEEKWPLLLVLAPLAKELIGQCTDCYLHALSMSSSASSPSSPTTFALPPVATLLPEVEVHLYELLGALLACSPQNTSFASLAAYVAANPTSFPSQPPSSTVTSNATTPQELLYLTHVQPLQLQHLQDLWQLHWQARLGVLLAQQQQFVHTNSGGGHGITVSPAFESYVAQQIRVATAFWERFHRSHFLSPASSSTASVDMSGAGGQGGTSAYLSWIQVLCARFGDILSLYAPASSGNGSNRHGGAAPPEVVKLRLHQFLHVLVRLVPADAALFFLGHLLPLLLSPSSSPNTSSARGRAGSFGSSGAMSTGANSGETGSQQSSLESLVELLNQLMSTFDPTTAASSSSSSVSSSGMMMVQLLQSLFPTVFVQVCTWAEEQCLLLFQQQRGGVGNVNGVVVDVHTPVKTLLSLLQHITQHGLAHLLLQPLPSAASGSLGSNDSHGRTYLACVLDWLPLLVKGFAPVYWLSAASNAASANSAASASVATGATPQPLVKLVKYTTLSLRRGTILIVCHLAQAWLFPVSSSVAMEVSEEIRRAFADYVLDVYLPCVGLVLGTVQGAHVPAFLQQIHADYDQVKINVHDAAAQGVLLEAAGLLYLLTKGYLVDGGVSSQPQVVVSRDFAVHLRQVLIGYLQWSEDAFQGLTSMLVTSGASSSGNGSGLVMKVPLGTFKEQFKQFARAHLA